MDHTLDRNPLAAEMINTLMDYLQRFSDQDMSDFMEESKNRDCLYTQPFQCNALIQQSKVIA